MVLRKAYEDICRLTIKKERKDNMKAEYYLYFVDEKGQEDLLWYTEDVNEVTEEQAIERFNKVKTSGSGLRLYRITRPENKKTIVIEKVAS
jgi:hypothetical protein